MALVCTVKITIEVLGHPEEGENISDRIGKDSPDGVSLGHSI